VTKNLYFDRIIVHRLYQQDSFFPIGKNKSNIIIILSGTSSSKNFQCLASKTIVGLDFLEKTQCLPLYRYENGEKIDNITDWGLQQFREYYQPSPRGKGLGVRAISKLDIFHYVYAVLHNPKYREKYELNLKRDFPRIPFYSDFNQWKNWGKQLMELHLNYETITPYQLKRVDSTLTPNPSPTGEGKRQIKLKLKADTTKDHIIIDEITTLPEIPPIVWEYKLGNRSALEWILDQYKEKKPKDSTIAEKFNNYRFSDYKEQAIDLLMRVTTVSIETMKIINQMNIRNPISRI
jgi:predicted helicase